MFTALSTLRQLGLMKCISYRKKLHDRMTTMNIVLLEKLTVSQLAKYFPLPPFYITRRFITIYKRPRHFSIS